MGIECWKKKEDIWFIKAREEKEDNKRRKSEER